MNMQNIEKSLCGFGPKLLLPAILATLALSSPAWTAAQTPDPITEPYSARYSVYRNDKLQARSEFQFQHQDNRWTMKNESIGTHGMARFLKFRDYEFAEGEINGDQFRPLSYVHDLKWIGPNQSSAAEFDWEGKTVTVSNDGETLTLDLVDGAIDPMSLQLAIRRELASAQPRLEFMLVEKDEIEAQVFRALPPERLETSLGCLDTIAIEKVRENSRRFTRFWFARELGYIPVRMEHGKVDGDRMELRITELQVAGANIEPQPGC